MQVPNVNVQISLKYLLIQLIEFNSSSGLCQNIGFNIYINNNNNKIKIEIIDKFILIKFFISIFFTLNKTMIPIKIPKDLSEEALIFHAGTDEILGSPVSAGGRVINVVFRAPSLEEAVIGAYASVKRIQFPGAHYRTDIGGRLRGV